MGVKNCPWWIRWLHRRLRRIDRLTILRRLEQHAAVAHFDTPDFARFAWEQFKQEKGQEHWRCSCAIAEDP
jgi:hypothetical protein